MKIPLPNRASRAVYFVHVDKFMNEQYDEDFRYDRLSKRFSRILDNREIQYAEHIFPLSVVVREAGICRIGYRALLNFGKRPHKIPKPQAIANWQESSTALRESLDGLLKMPEGD